MKHLLFSVTRATFIAVLAFAAVCRSEAQQMSIPVEVPVTFQIQMQLPSWFHASNYDTGGGPEVGLYFYAALSGGTSELDNYAMANNWNTGSLASGKVKPGCQYTLFVEADVVDSYNVNISPVEGYRVFMDNVERYRVDGNGGGGYISRAVVFHLEPVEPAAPAGTAESIESGGKIFWRAAMGSLRNGGSAGYLTIRETDFSANLFKPNALQFACASSEVESIYSSGVLRQVLAMKALADIFILSTTAYEIRYYKIGQFGTTKSGGVYPITGSPFVVYKIERDGFDTKLKITRTVGAKSWQTRLEKSGSVWTLYDWYEGASFLRKKTWTVGPSNAYIDVEVRNGANTLASKSRENYTAYTWGAEVTSETFGYSGPGLTSTYGYITSSPNLGKLQTMTRPDGSWLKNDYFNSSIIHNGSGLISKNYEPYIDLPATPPASGSTSGKVTYTSYAADWTGLINMPNVVETKINNVSVAKSIFSYNYTNTVSAHGQTLPLTTVTRQDYDSASTSVTTITKSFRPDADPAGKFFPGLVHSAKHPDGTLKAHAYLKGYYLSTYAMFIPDANGSERLEVVYYGASAPATGLTAFTTAGSGGHTYDIEDVYLKPFVSTKKETIRGSTGEAFFEAEYLYTGGSSFTLIKGTYVAHDDFGAVDTITNIYAAGTPTGITYVTAYDATFANGLKTSEIDEAGIETTFAYDAMGRLSAQTKKGVASFDGFPSQPDIVTNFTYDAESRILSQSTGPATQIATTSTFDTAGRVLTETIPGPAGNITTAYTYPAARRVRTTFGDGGFKEEEFYLDGKLKSVTGDAVVGKFVTYFVEGTGIQGETETFASGTNDGYAQRKIDWLGRPRQEVALNTFFPGVSNSWNVVDYYYNSVGQLSRKTFSSPNGSAKLAHDTLYVYDTLGRVVQEGADLNANLALDAASNDRIKIYTSDYVLDNGAYWQRLKSEIYPTLNSGTLVSLGETRERATHLSSTLKAETKTIDANGNTTYSTVAADVSKNASPHPPPRPAPPTSPPMSSTTASSPAPPPKKAWSRTSSTTPTAANPKRKAARTSKPPSSTSTERPSSTARSATTTKPDASNTTTPVGSASPKSGICTPPTIKPALNTTSAARSCANGATPSPP